MSSHYVAYLDPANDRFFLLDAAWAIYHHWVIEYFLLIDPHDLLRDQNDVTDRHFVHLGISVFSDDQNIV